MQTHSCFESALVLKFSSISDCSRSDTRWSDRSDSKAAWHPATSKSVASQCHTASAAATTDSSANAASSTTATTTTGVAAGTTDNSSSCGTAASHKATDSDGHHSQWATSAIDHRRPQSSAGSQQRIGHCGIDLGSTTTPATTNKISATTNTSPTTGSTAAATYPTTANTAAATTTTGSAAAAATEATAATTKAATTTSPVEGLE